MIKRHQTVFNAINVVSDIALIWLSCFLAWNIRFDVLDGILQFTVTPIQVFLYPLIYSAFNAFVLSVFRLYSPQRLKMTGSNTLRIIEANGVSALTLFAMLFIIRLLDVPRLFVVLLWIISSLLISLKHILLQKALHYVRRKGYNQKHYVLIGNGHLAQQYLEDIKNNPFTGIMIDGYVSIVEKPGLGTNLGRYEDLERIIDETNCDGIVIALEAHEVNFMKDILAVADKEGLHVEMIPFFNDYYPANPDIDSIGKTKLIDLRSTPLNTVRNAFLKRSTDIVASLVFLILLSPLMLFAAIGVRCSSRGPIIFRQERIGKDKKVFTMYKFRSMRVNEREKTEWTTDEDARKTRFGSLIRKTSIDELPQLFNVLRGDMSLIGPRPEIPYHVDHFKNEIPRYLVRQQVRPGMTGWAQVNGYRGDTSIEERIKYDIDYIEKWSVGWDIRIAFKTVFGGLINKEKA